MFPHPSFRAARHSLLYPVAVVFIFGLTSLCYGQGSTPQRGYQPGGSYALSDIETINVGNGNMMLNLPLGKLPAGRGGLSAQINLHYDSKLYDSHTQYYQDWDHLQQNGDPRVVVRSMLAPTEQGGWHYGTGYTLQIVNRTDQYPYQMRPQYPDDAAIYRWKVKVAFPDGSVHEFVPRGFGSEPLQDGFYDIRPDGWQTRWAGTPCWPPQPGCIYADDVSYLTGTLTYYSFDGSFARLEIEHDSNSSPWDNPWTLYLSDGTKVRNGNVITDRNGNSVTISNITYNGNDATQLADQLGRRVVLERASSGDIIHVPGVGGADLAYTIHWKIIQVCKTYSTVTPDAYDQSGYADMLGTQQVVSEIDLPPETGGLKYLFSYNASDYDIGTFGTPETGWGEISSMTLPSGAVTQYQYSLDGQNGPGILPENVLQSAVARKTLTYLQEYDGNSTQATETWNYNSLSQGSIVGPDGGLISGFRDMQREYRIEHPDGTVVERIWQGNVPQGFPVIHSVDPMTGYDLYETSRINPFIKTEFTSIKDANGSLTKTAIKDFNYDKNGNLTSVADYDWVDYASVPRGGAGSLPTGIPGSAVLKRVTTNTLYRWTPDAADTSSNVADSYWNSSAPSLRNALASNEVSNGSQIFSRAEFTYDDPATTGNLTQQKSWDSTKGAYSNPLTTNSVSVSTQYNQYGSPTLTTDARGVQTLLTYGSVAGVSDLYPTQVQTAYGTSLQRTETREYDFYTGVVTRATDADNNVSASTTYDIFGRPTLVKAAEGKAEETRSSTEYSDANRRVIVRSDLNTAGDGKLVAIQYYDQLGRIRLTRQLEDSTNQSATDETAGIKVQTRYVVSNPCQPADTAQCLSDNSSVLGSYQLSSNPYRAAHSSTAGSEVTMGWTRSRSDKGGRMTEVQTFGGASLPGPWGANTTTTGTVSTAYDANFTTVTDQAGRVRRSMTNALGQLGRIDEPDGNGNLGATDTPAQPTSYSYDTLGNLVTVNQGSQTRSFTYSSLARLLSAANPESGTITYQYDNGGNLTQRTDARSISATYAYDSLNRVTGRSYSDGTPAVSYSYDPNIAYGRGRLASVSSSVSSYNYSSYDAMGRVLSGSQVLGSQTYSLGYTYDLASHVKTMQYPSGRTVTDTYDNGGRTIVVAGTLGDGTPRPYTTGITYGPGGQMTQEQFGTTTAIFNKLFYNSRGQLAEILAATNGNDASFNRGKIVNDYSSQCSGASCNGTNNNGNLLKQTVYVPNNEQNTNPTSWYQQYGYDSLNRLTQVHEYTGNTNLDWQQGYSYDRFGNRTINPNNNGGNATWGDGINNVQAAIDQNNNRMLATNDPNHTMIDYDAAGNQTKDYLTSNGTRVFDAENRMTSATDSANHTSAYSYDGDGHRVKRNIAGTDTWQVYGLGGELIAEYAANTAAANPQKEYAYRNGQMLVTATSGTEWGSAPTYTAPNPLVAGIEIKLEHLTELRTAVNQLRTHAGLSAATWTVDPNPVRYVTEVKADHILQLRAALEGARSHLGLSTGGYAHPGLHTGDTIYAVDFQELRDQIAVAWNSVQINWLVSDQLGTPRMVFDQSGSLATTSRHDYLPFGEEVFANTGGRTTAQGYTASDNVRQKFTSKERDNETGLDYFGARYYSSSQGRFTSSDPLGGHILNPQTLNKYVYVRDNPPNLTDPTGMYICADSKKCDSKDDKEFEKARQRNLKSKDRDVVRGAMAYGDPSKDNGVTVKYGDPGKGKDGNTIHDMRSDPNDNSKVQAVETVIIRSGLRGSDLDAAVGHEGSHVADAQEFVATVTPQGYDLSKNLTTYATELRAYMVTQSVLASNNEQRDFGQCGFDPCRLGTRVTADKANEIIKKMLANPDNHYGSAPNYGVTPSKPGPLLYPSLTTPTTP